MNSTRAAAVAVVLIAFAAVLGVSEFVAGRFLATKRYVPITNEQLAFYEKHYEELNHLRSIYVEPRAAGTMDTPESLMFTVIGDGPRRVLVQGDSWAEQFIASKPTRELLRDFAARDSDTFVLAGTTSYAPSPMTVQLRTLRAEFGVKADVVIAVIDQTDVGDELCRYRPQRQHVNGTLVVRPFPFNSTEVYALRKPFAQQDIIDADDWALVKLVRLARIRIAALLDRADRTPKCPWEAIARPLREGVSPQDRQYFLSVLDDYVEMVFAAPETTHLFLVTHRHRLHATGEYRLDVGDLLREEVSRSRHGSRITIVDFPHDTRTSADAGIYVDGDPASHLTDEAHAKFYVPAVLKSLVEHR